MMDLSTGDKFKIAVAPFSLHVPVDVAARIKDKGSKQQVLINWEELVHSRTLSPSPYISIRSRILDDDTNSTDDNSSTNNTSPQKPETPSEHPNPNDTRPAV